MNAPDAHEYVTAAQSIINGAYQSMPDDPQGLFRYYRVPGYPTLVALFSFLTGTSPASGWFVIVNPVFVGLLVVSIYQTARLLDIPPRVSTLAGFLASISPTTLSVTPLLLTDIPTSAILAISLWLVGYGAIYGNMRHTVLAGVLVGIATLMRPAAVVAVVLLPVFALLWPKRGKIRKIGFTIMVAVSLLPSMAWTLHVHRQVDVWTIETHASSHAYLWMTTALATGSDSHIQEAAVDALAERRARAIKSGLITTERDRIAWERNQTDSLLTVYRGAAVPALVRSAALLLVSPTKDFTAQFPDVSGVIGRNPPRIVSSLRFLLIAWGFVALLLAKYYRVVVIFLLLIFSVLLPNLSIGGLGAQRHMLGAAVPLFIALSYGISDLVRRLRFLKHAGLPHSG